MLQVERRVLAVHEADEEEGESAEEDDCLLGRHRRAGITAIGVGLGLMLLIGTTADISIGIGVGGFLVMIGLAFLLNSMFEDPISEPGPPTAGYEPSMPSPPPASPSAVATPPEPPRG